VVASGRMARISLGDAKLKMQLYGRFTNLLAIIWMLMWILILAPHLDGTIIACVLLGLGLYVFRTMRPRIVALGRTADGAYVDAEEHNLKTCPYISVLRMENPLFFANSSYFENTLLERMPTKPRLKPVVVDCEAISDINVTGEQMLRETALRLRASGTEMLFACAKGKLQAAFIQSGFIQQLGEKLFFQTRAQALEYAWQ
jgi:sulfate permease, SulP family